MVTGQEFRGAMGRLASGVALVTATDEHGRPQGMTATAVSSVSVDPPQLLVCVHAESRTHEHIERAGAFGVDLLAADQQWLSNHCARPGEDKGLQPEWLDDSGASATPAVRGCIVHLDCRVVEAVAAATHSIFVAGVETVLDGSGVEPLIYFQGEYCASSAL